MVINGDLVLNNGQPGDCVHFAKLIAPLLEADISVHLTMGNHDNRDVFQTVLNSEQNNNTPVKSKHVAVVRTAKSS